MSPLRNSLPERTPSDVFMRRYQWLLRWAMHFARNDRTTAEDLIQDTFLRFSQANLKVAEIRDPEALLYTYLEHVHLTHRREVSRHSFVSLADAQLDALALGLLAGPDVDRIETQNMLRRIAAYVAWRKQTSKSAGIVALRFFHGYLPEEIARMALVSREAVDERLHKGRNEIRLHLSDAEKLRDVQHGGPVKTFPSKVVVPADGLLAELRDQLFRASHGACMPAEQLAARYRKSPDLPIRRDLFAHIVSCRECLGVVERVSRRNQSPPAGGSAGGFRETEWSRSQRDLPLSSAKEIENLLLRTERRLKEIYEHRPTSLILAVNGEVLASRDIGASFNGLKVEAPTRGLKFIEVLTEHGASLLSWAVESTPPHSDPVVHRVAEFSMGRRLGVDLQFSAHKVIIEAQYQDPFYGEILSPSFAAMARNSDEEDEAEVVLVKPRDSWAAVLHRKLLTQWRRFTFTPLIATGLVCAVVLVAGLFLDLRGFNRVKPGEFMQRAMVSERRDAQSAKSGVILQQVAIRSSQGSFERSIYRDPEGKRHVKRPPLDERKKRLKERLAEAGIDWDAPLSAASFAEWQAHSHIKDESVHSVNDKFLTLSVDTEGSDVEQETITIRTADFHPVGRTAEFRDVGTIEIAEVNYAVIPWATVNQGLFENDAFSPGPLAAAPRQLPLLPRPSSLSEVDLDLLELKVRTALHELHADSTDRLTVSRNTSGVQVSGMVEDDKQKLELKRRLSQFPHVSANLTTVNDATLRPQETKPPGSVQLVSVVAGPSLLETFLLEQGKSREVSNDLADRLFAASSALLRANKAELKLQERFRSDTLSPAALDLYERLLDSWFGELNTALSDESEAIRQTGIQIEPAKPGRSEQAAISAEVEKNRVLLKELIGHDAPATRTAPVVLADLARSVESLRTASNEEHEKVPQRRSPSIPSARNIQP